MLLWILIACLTAAAIMAVLLPLGRAREEADAVGKARRVYLDQLTEFERDRASGRIDAGEAEAVRAEIARRLLAADRTDAPHERTTASPLARRATALGALFGIPILALALYMGLGSPSLPGQPLAARLAAPSSPNDIEALIAKVEEHLEKEPEDGDGWEVIAPVYQRLGRSEDAAMAYRNAIRLLGSTAARQSGLGEAILTTQDGIVTAEARAAFEAANALEPQAPAPRFFLGLAAEQEGKLAEAAEAWRSLLAEAPADAPWRAAVQTALARVDPQAPPPGPAAADVAAAENMSPIEQTAMIEGMVASLAERLKREPDDVEGWLRLIRSYAVLGRQDAAAEAARAALEGVADGNDRERVEALIADLQLTPEEPITQ